jgi:hypothetical protein
MSALRTQPYFPELAGDGVTRFSQALLSSLPRADQRRWADLYLRGLMCLEGKKSIRRIAESLPYPTAVQSLQQFLNQSPWDWAPIGRALHDYVVRETAPSALSVGVVHIPKRGSHSIGVRRRFVREADRLVNAQIGVGLFLTSERTSIPVGWRIVLDGGWSSSPELRQKAAVPRQYRVDSVSKAVLDILDEHRHEEKPRAVLADMRGTPDLVHLVAGLSERGREFVVEVDGTVPIQLVGVGSGRSRIDPPPVPLRSLCDDAGHRYPVVPVPRDGRRSRPATTALVRLPNLAGPRRMFRVIAQRAVAGDEGRYWVTNMLDQQRWGDAAGLILLHSRHTSELREFRESFGVGDFQGRSFVGWQHHMTLSSAAFAASRLVCGTGSAQPYQEGTGRPRSATGCG